MIKKFEQFINESIKDYLKPKDISNVIDIRDQIYMDQNKCKYDILLYLTSIGFKFNYPIELNTTPNMFDMIGSILITDFIKEHRKSMPNFNRLTTSQQDTVWDDRMDNYIIPKIKEIFIQFGFEFESVSYGGGDLKITFSTPHDNLLTYSKNVPRCVSDTMIKKVK